MASNAAAKLFDAYDCAATQTSDAFPLHGANRWSAQVELTNADVAGTLVFQVSDDGVTWHTVSGLSITITAAVAVSQLTDKDLLARYVRAVFTRSAGTTGNALTVTLARGPRGL